MRILVLGVTGMLGSAVFRVLSVNKEHKVFATLRDDKMLSYFDFTEQKNLITSVDVLDKDRLEEVFEEVQPECVINCVGVIKQLASANNPLTVLPLNTLFPHQLAQLCHNKGTRLIHISTDCVFNGRKGSYQEQDTSDAEDLYGKSKYMGELHDLPYAVTIRTSIIGHELCSKDSLIDWFLSQQGQIKGYRNAIFSGLPTVELAQVINSFILPNKKLRGLYHVSAQPIDKFTLLKLVTEIYEKDIDILPDDKVQIDRSLDSMKFRRETGYSPPSWPILIDKMYRSQRGSK